MAGESVELSARGLAALEVQGGTTAHVLRELLRQHNLSLERVRVRAEPVVDRSIAQLVARLARPLLRAELAEAAQVGAPSHLRTARNQTLRHRRKRALQKANASVLFTHTHQQVESF